MMSIPEKVKALTELFKIVISNSIPDGECDYGVSWGDELSYLGALRANAKFIRKIVL